LMAICKHWIPACAGTRETRNAKMAIMIFGETMFV